MLLLVSRHALTNALTFTYKCTLSVDLCANTHALIEVRPYTCPDMYLWNRAREITCTFHPLARSDCPFIYVCVAMCVAVCCNVCCSVLQCVAVCCSVLQNKTGRFLCTATHCNTLQHTATQKKSTCLVFIYMWSATEIFFLIWLFIYSATEIYGSANLSICEVREICVCLSVYLSIFVCLSVCLSICLSVCLSVYLSV